MLRIRHCRHVLVALGASVLLAACGGGSSSGSAEEPASPVNPAPPAAPVDRVALGEKLFNETRLSASGQQSCASCHVKEAAHADAPGGFLPFGGAQGDRQGLRSSPTLRYLDAAPAFSFGPDGAPRGGLSWDGRANTRAEQARGPLLSATEMANADEAAIARTLRALPYLGELQRAYALTDSASDTQLIKALTQALADYQAGDADYHLFSSKFDAVQAGRASFTVQEARGLAAFNDPARGNCASCHSSTPPAGEKFALFTNFSYAALGVPRNRSAATLDANFYDMGLCGPLRTDLTGRTELCGQFKVPTLRNVSRTAPYFHNGVLNTLEEVVGFYATRDLDPRRWYPLVGGAPDRFNDLPPAYRGNVIQTPPFGLRPGDRPRLSPQDVQDIAVFLRTLEDGYTAP